jgi:hypothetical protein
MKKRITAMSIMILIAFTACGGSNVPKMTMLSDNTKSVNSFEVSKSESSQGNIERKIKISLEKSPMKCIQPKKSKHLIFDIYHVDNCKLNTTFKDGYLVRSLTTYRSSLTKHGTNAPATRSTDIPSVLKVFSKINILRSDTGAQISIDAISKVKSVKPDGVPHYWDDSEFIERFNEELIILDIK